MPYTNVWRQFGLIQVESFREMVYATLEEHCRVNHDSEPSRFAKLLLRLPALRSIGLKCAEHTFFFKLIKEERPVFAGADLRDLVWIQSKQFRRQKFELRSTEWIKGDD